MPVIARRTLLCGLAGAAACLAPAAASDADQISDLLFNLSYALQDGNAATFLSLCDKSHFPDYSRLEENVVALTAQYQISSSIATMEQARSGEGYALKLDWLLHATPINGDGTVKEKRQVLDCRVERAGKRWKVAAPAPVSFFQPE